MEKIYGRDIPLKIKEGKKVLGKKNTYQIEYPVGRGGSGIVYKARCLKLKKAVAIKFFLPLYEMNVLMFQQTSTNKNILEEIDKLHKREIECLHELTHPNIITILDYGSYNPPKRELIQELHFMENLNFFVMDYIYGMNIQKYLDEKEPSKMQIISILNKLCDALLYLHETREYLHGDLRVSNVLIRDEDSEPVIIDFALYKNLNFDEVNPKDITKLLGDWDLFPKKIDTVHPLKKLKETSGTRESLKQFGFPVLDLFQFGKLLEKLTYLLNKSFSIDEQEYVRLLIDELTIWERVEKLNSKWLFDQISKLSPTYTHFMSVEELIPPNSAKITRQLSREVLTISPLVKKIINTKSFQRLRTINQLSLVDILYPGAGYKRYLHSLGAYGNCMKTIESLSNSSHFRMFFSPQQVRQGLMMALLHDINHFPFLHIFQEIRDNLIGEFNILDTFCNGIATQDEPSIYKLIDTIGISPETFKGLILLQHHEIAEKGYPPSLQVIKSMIDSGADVDKLTYLEDDSFYSGVRYGNGLDVGRLLASTTVISVPDTINNSWHIGFLENGLSAVEGLVMARYWMFRQVYWHRKNRAIISMLLDVIKKIYIDKKSNVDDFITETMWMSEQGVLGYLNQKYKSKFGADSIIGMLLKDEKCIYRRLLTIQGASRAPREAELYQKISKINSSRKDIEIFKGEFINALEDYIKLTFNKKVKISEEELLFDIPGRKLETPGSIYIKLETGETERIEDVSATIKEVYSNFDKLAKRMRVFVSPRIFYIFGNDEVLKRRQELIKNFEQSIPKRENLDQIR